MSKITKKQANQVWDRLFKKRCPYCDIPMEQTQEEGYIDYGKGLPRHKQYPEYYCPNCERLFDVDQEGNWGYTSPKDGRWRPLKKGLKSP